MGDPRNPTRVDEKWDAHRLSVMDLEIRSYLCEVGVLSGGWAWHYMSPPHEEFKLLHDHKDIDLFIRPDIAGTIIAGLKANGYESIWTQYDDPSGQFQRVVQHIDGVKIIIDLFVEEVPYILLSDNIRVVEPIKLLSYYSLKKHTTDDCVAVIAARRLLKEGKNIPKSKELIDRTLFVDV